jgi:alanine-synthesizing transaminase
MKVFHKSHKLDNVLYDIRGPVLREAQRLEAEGYKILKLHTGNPAPFGLFAPDEIVHDVVVNLQNSQGYCDDSRGLFAARKAVMQYCQQKGIPNVTTDDIFIGNGVSELITMSMQALLNTGNEVLIPTPDYPLWTASVNLSGGKAVHYLCDEQSDWIPDIKDIERKITPRTKGIVVINPNNPTGAVYPLAVLEKIVEIAAKHGLILFADEIYDKILYDGAEHTSLAALAPDDLFCVTFNGLSKSYRAAGFRTGWMILSGNKGIAKDYIEGITMLSSMRLCANVPTQYAVQTALGGYQSINDLIRPGGRLYEQRKVVHEKLLEIPGISCVKPMGALYAFPRIDAKKFNIANDRTFIYDLLVAERILVVQGTGFNWAKPDHFRIVFLPTVDVLAEAINKLGRFLASYRQSEE